VRNLEVKVLILVALCITQAHAQYKTMELKPIQKHGWNYYYDFKKVSTADALQIPLQAMNDASINKYYKTFNGLQLGSSLVFLAPLLYILYNVQNNTYDAPMFWGLTVGAIGVSLAMEIWSHNRMKLAIERYNTLLLPHPSGRIPQSPALSIGFRLN
jgi:hypothetical protein